MALVSTTAVLGIVVTSAAAAGEATQLVLSAPASSTPAGVGLPIEASTFDSSGHFVADVTAQTTFVPSSGATCVANACTAEVQGNYTVTATYGMLTKTFQLEVSIREVRVTVNGEIVNHNQVFFSASFTGPDGVYRVLSGLACRTLSDNALITTALPFGNYQLNGQSCSYDYVPLPNFKLDFVSGYMVSSKFGITSGLVADGRINTAYSSRLTAVGGTSYTWSVTSGALPTGLSLASSGQISGKPVTAGTYLFTATVHSGAQSMSWPYSVTISDTSQVPLSFTTSWLKPATLGVSYSVTIHPAGGQGTRHWSVTGNLPAGLRFSNGTISGVPRDLNGASFNVTLIATGSIDQQLVRRTFAVLIVPMVFAPGPVLKTGKVKSYYSVTFHVNEHMGATIWGQDGDAPAWVKLSRGGILSGTPTAAGTFNFMVGVGDAYGNRAVQPVSITITS